jgi:glutathione S-transferase
MKIYHHPLSHNGRRCLAVAIHVGAQHESVVVDVVAGAHKKPEFLAMNPNGMIPVMVDGDFVLNESSAIAYYLADKAKSPLLPTESKARADVMRWVAWDSSHWNDACSTILFENAFKPMFGGQTDPAAVAKATESFHRFAKILDAHLASKKFMTGDKVSLADFAVASPLSNAVIGKIPVGDYTNITKWFERMNEVPGWKETTPPSLG